MQFSLERSLIGITWMLPVTMPSQRRAAAFIISSIRVNEIDKKCGSTIQGVADHDERPIVGNVSADD